MQAPGEFVERRTSQRQPVYLASRLDAPDRSRTAVTMDLSVEGARFLSIGRFRAGETVDVWMMPATSKAQVHARGRVVRAEPYSVSGPWRCQVAVEFDPPLPSDESSLLLQGAHDLSELGASRTDEL